MALYSIETAPGGFAILHNGKKLETPAGSPLIVPTRPLAEAIAAEKPLNRRVDPKTMPLLQLAAIAIDIIAPKRQEAIDRIAAYAGSELLCYRADQPPALAREQDKIWQPLLDWCAKHFDAPLKTATGIMPIAQPSESLARLCKAIECYDPFRLAGLSIAVIASGSLVLGLALDAGQLNSDEVCHAAELDADYQMKDWGEDPDIKTRIEATQKELNVCEKWLTLLASPKRKNH